MINERTRNRVAALLVAIGLAAFGILEVQAQPKKPHIRDGKGMLYEGGTRVVALANWPGHITPGSVVDQPIHMVDMYPTLAGLAGASLSKNKPLDGLDVWPTLSEGKASPRDEVVYDIEPFRSAAQGGLEAGVAGGAPILGGAVQPGPGPFGEDESR